MGYTQKKSLAPGQTPNHLKWPTLFTLNKFLVHPKCTSWLSVNFQIPRKIAHQCSGNNHFKSIFWVPRKAPKTGALDITSPLKQ